MSSSMRLAFLLAFFSCAAHAQPACSPTASIAPAAYPGAKQIIPSNNLVLPAGKSVEAEGQKLVLQGRVLDAQCKPVPEAVVELWQANPFGNRVLADGDALATPNATFAGAGRVVTDIDGSFEFITVFPGPIGKRAPHLNIRVAAEKMPGFSTILYFENDGRNARDEVLRKLKPAARESITMDMSQTDDGQLVGSIDLVLRSKAPYRTY